MKSAPAEWVFTRSPEFIEARDRMLANFESEYVDVSAHHSPELTKAFLAELRKLSRFLDLIDSVETGKAAPEKYLVYVCEVGSGSAYSMVLKDWRCFYVVDRKARTCTAVQMDLMTTTAEASEYHRRHSGSTRWFER